MIITKRIFGLGMTITLAWGPPVSGQEDPARGQDPATTSELIEEIEVIGTRRDNINFLSSPVPVDVYDEEKLEVIPQTNFKDTLQRIVPSFSVEQDAVGDQVSFNRSASLRGFDLSQVVVLLNGKRLHRSSILINANQSVAIESIPSSAISNIQVLRTGAAAQYGADAVAGVINLQLKNKPGISGFARFGQHYQGDGAERVLGSHLGFPLGETGNINITAVYRNADPSNRADPHQGAAFHSASNLPGSDQVPIVQAPYGKIERDDYKLTANAAASITDSAEFYAFGNWMEGWYDQPFNFRTRFLPPDGRLNDSFQPTELTAAELGPEFAHLEGWSPAEVFPGGYIPNFEGNIQDLSIFGGFRGKFDNGLTWDISGMTGIYRLALEIGNTLNPSLGATQDGFVQTDFDLGEQINQESTFNLDFTYPLEVAGLYSPVNVAFGAEYRRERYEIEIGEPASFQTGPLSDLETGSDGFTGFGPLSVMNASRDNYALYVDLNADVTSKLNVGIAGRFEDFSDFGSEFIWKLSGRYDFTPGLAVRASVSTGFQAPQVAQSNLLQVVTDFEPNVIGSNQLGTFPPGSEVAQIFGATPLEPQDSIDGSFGFVVRPSDSSFVTVDAYVLELEDRITDSSDFDRDDSRFTDEFAAVDALDLSGFGSINSVEFFTNTFDSRTFGVEVVAQKDFEFDNGHTLDLSLGYAFTDTEVTNESEIFSMVNPPLDSQDIFTLENDISGHKGNFTAVYKLGKFTITPTVRVFGPQKDFLEDESRGPINTPTTVFLDVNAAYQLTENIKLTLGADNILDEFPKNVMLDKFRGRKYADGIPWQGGFWYTSISAEY